MNKNRILILTGVFPPDIGGPATQLDALSCELIKRDYKIRILTFGKSDKKIYPYSVKRISNYWPGPLKSFVFLIHGLLFSLRADILYNYDLYTAGLTGLLIKKIFRKPLITRFVGDSAWETACSQGKICNDDIMAFQEKKYSWRIELRKKIRKKILINSDKIIVVSYFLQDLAKKIGLPEEKIKVIYNSIDFLDTESVVSEENLKQKFGFEGIILLTIARLTPWKGIDTLIEIMPELIKKYNKINLVIVGKGEQLDYLKQLSSSLGLENYIFFQGKLDRKQIIEHLKSADMFLLNTNYEGMSHTILEAMKIGAPVVTTKAGGNPETIKHGQTGLLVDYKNKEQWLKAIEMILDNSDFTEKIVNQAKEDLKRFSWPNLVEETVKVFKNINA